MLKLDSTGLEVRRLQSLLNDNGERVAADGWFGIETLAAVMSVQRRYGLVVDGIAGPKTLAALNARNRPAKLLCMADLERAAARLDVPLAAVRAVNEVESRGQGFLPDGRPVILFERHIMHRRLAERGFDADAHAARLPAVVNPERGGYVGGSGEHRRLALAADIHTDTAIESASWGLFQIMGFHWQQLGYASAVEFEALMSRSEADQLAAFVRFIETAKPLHKALRAGKWEAFALGYNGPAYAQNLYDVRLARAFDRYSAETAAETAEA